MLDLIQAFSVLWIVRGLGSLHPHQEATESCAFQSPFFDRRFLCCARLVVLVERVTYQLGDKGCVTERFAANRVRSTLIRVPRREHEHVLECPIANLSDQLRQVTPAYVLLGSEELFEGVVDEAEAFPLRRFDDSSAQ